SSSICSIRRTPWCCSSLEARSTSRASRSHSMICTTRTAVVAMAVFVFLPACHRPGGPRPPASETAPRIELNLGGSRPGSVGVIGLPADDLWRLERRALSAEEWTALLRVAVATEGGAVTDRPAVLGTHAIVDGRLRFTPRFPFDPGQRYDVVLDPVRLSG